MPKKRAFTHEERLAMTMSSSKLLQDIRNGKNLPPPASGAEEINEKNLIDEKRCPVCGAELIHVEGCCACPNKCWSKCG